MNEKSPNLVVDLDVVQDVRRRAIIRAVFAILAAIGIGFWLYLGDVKSEKIRASWLEITGYVNAIHGELVVSSRPDVEDTLRTSVTVI